MNGTVLNSSLTPLSGTTAGGLPGSSGLPVGTTTGSAIAAVAAVDATTVARFSQPVRANANATVSETPTVQLVNATTAAMRSSSPVLEGPLSSQVGEPEG